MNPLELKLNRNERIGMITETEEPLSALDEIYERIMAMPDPEFLVAYG